MTVEEAVKKSCTYFGMGKGCIKAAQAMLLQNEDVIYAGIYNVAISPVIGNLDVKMFSLKGKITGAFAITTQKILFVNNVLGRGTSKQIPLSEIRSIDDKSEAFGSALRIVGLSQMFVIDCSPQNLSNIKTAISTALSLRNTPAAPAAPTAPASQVDQLRALKQLYDEGVLTAEEFAAKKAQILGI